jgi:two-component system LytT family response regulator
MIRSLIVDDEQYSRETLKELVTDYCSEVKILDVANNADTAFDLCLKYSPELVFLDINMPVSSGFDFLDRFEKINFHIIFTTAYNQFAIKAFRYSALDYLLKPINISELQEAVLRIKELKAKINLQATYDAFQYFQQNKKFDKIALPTKEGYVFILTDSITSIEADGNYSMVNFTDRKSLIVSKNLQDFEDTLDENQFLRLHRSYLVNLNHAQSFNTKEKYLVLSDGAKIPVSSRKKTALLKICQTFQ